MRFSIENYLQQLRQPTGQLSLPSIRGRQLSSKPCHYMDYGAGDY